MQASQSQRASDMRLDGKGSGFRLSATGRARAEGPHAGGARGRVFPQVPRPPSQGAALPMAGSLSGRVGSVRALSGGSDEGRYTGRREHRKSRLLGRLALGRVRSGSRVGDALRLPGLEDDHLAAAVDGRCLGDVRNPDEPDCCAGEPEDERQERKGGDVSARRLLMNGRDCGFADKRNLRLEDDFGSDDVVRPVVGHMSARGHTEIRRQDRLPPHASLGGAPCPRWPRERAASGCIGDGGVPDRAGVVGARVDTFRGDAGDPAREVLVL